MGSFLAGFLGDEEVLSWPAGLFFETYSSLLMANLESIDRRGVKIEDAIQGRKREYPVIKKTLELLRERGKDTERVLRFLVDVRKNRGGVLIGFNEAVIQGECVTDATDRDLRIVHGVPEMAVRPEGGFIDLSGSPIVGIECLGDYEERLVRELGLG
jgi:hypothetical protein